MTVGARPVRAPLQPPDAGDACILCGRPPRRTLIEHPRRLLECSGCGFVYAHPRLSSRELKAYYGADSRPRPPGERSSWFTALVARAIAAGDDLHRLRLALARERVHRLASLIPFSPKQTVLDVGCGRGEFLSALSTRFPGLSLVGIEPSPSEARYARETYGFDVREAMLEDARSLPKVDIVTMFHVLEHVCQPADALARAAALLKPSGLLVVEVPNMKLSRIELPFGCRLLSPGYHNPEHLWHFTPRSLRTLLKRQPFQLEALTTYTFGLHPLLDLLAFRTESAVLLRCYLLAARLLTAPLAALDGGLGLVAVARVQGSGR